MQFEANIFHFKKFSKYISICISKLFLPREVVILPCNPARAPKFNLNSDIFANLYQSVFCILLEIEIHFIGWPKANRDTYVYGYFYYYLEKKCGIICKQGENLEKCRQNENT